MNSRVLVVDDDRATADTLASLINAHGYEAIAAYDGRQALEQAVRFLPGLVLIDLGMPGWNGYETEIRIREQCGGHELIAVALTGWTRDEYRGRAWDCGFDLYVTKPMSTATLKQLLGLLDPHAPVSACEGLDEADLKALKALLYPTTAPAEPRPLESPICNAGKAVGHV
jgi:DNA-binding response OmpR family regulator